MGLLQIIQSRFKESQKPLEQGPEAQTQQTPSAQRQQVENTPKSSLKQKQQKKQDDECKKLYMLLLQKLVKVYAQNDLVVTSHPEFNRWHLSRHLSAKTKYGKFVYEVHFSNQGNRYYLNLESPRFGLINFGLYTEDPVFQDDKYDYASVLYSLTENGPSDMTREAIGALMEKDTQIDPSITPVWPSEMRNVFTYLDKFITR